MGFWFLQDPTVGPNAAGGFDGKHVDGDFSSQSSLTNGGGVLGRPRLQVGGRQLNEITGIDEGDVHGSAELGTMNACAFANSCDDHAPMGCRI